ncbi:MAG: prepilin-type N-terminal cleavage/methylation domain-containing protein [Rickettsiales bacterium]
MRAGKNAGFSLVELSISVLIIGMLVGGTLGGMRIVKQGKLKRLHTQISEAIQGASVFSEKFDALPGDMKNAYARLGSSCAGGSAAHCNGNGDGRIGYKDFDAETYMAWAHMRLADVYPGAYTGEAGSEPGVNVPEAALPSSALRWRYESISAFNDINVGNVLMVTSLDGNYANGAASAKDAYVIDAKFDDGLPTSGDVMGFYGTATTDGAHCFSGTYVGGDAAYLASQETLPGCVLLFKTPF